MPTFGSCYRTQYLLQLKLSIAAGCFSIAAETVDKHLVFGAGEHDTRRVGAMGLKLRVRWQACASAVDPAPLAVVLPWIWAEHKYIDKYARLLNAAGWDALIAEWPMQAMWFPLWTHGLALSLLQILGSELLSKGERPLVIYVFSGSVKVCSHRTHPSRCRQIQQFAPGCCVTFSVVVTCPDHC